MSALQRNVVAIVCVGALLALVMFAATQVAGAQTNVAAGDNATCEATCSAQAAKAARDHNNAENCTPTGTFVAQCQYSGSGGSVTGQCMGYVCMAKSGSTLGGGSQNASQGLQALGQALGSILGKLMQSSESATTPTTGTAGECTTSYYYTSNTALIGVDPCAIYQATATTCTDPTATNYGASAACTYNTTTCTDPTATNFGASAACTYATATTCTDPTATNYGASAACTYANSSGSTLSATPSSGSAPLSVTFTASAAGTGTYTVDPGDGGNQFSLSASSCAGTSAACTYQGAYTYQTAGTYTADLLDQDGDTLAGTSVSVENPGGSTSDTGLSQVLQNVGTLFGETASSTTGLQTSASFPGIFGNILLDQNGGTIFASTVNSANNSETSGFYGSDTLGSEPQSVVGQLCENRPWASNFLADVIPPSFFDSLCQWGGYQVGEPPAPAPQVTLSQQTQAPAPQPAATTTAATTTPSVPPQAVIWAVPSSVPLGTRTSVFWNTQGVSGCTESSPDGSFNEDSLSGAAATVPITANTTFTISCLDPNGNPVTDYVTVEISS